MQPGERATGGHLANWLQATTTRYKCLFSHAGLINLESQWGTSDTIYHREVANGGPPWEQGSIWREQNPVRFAKQFRTPILLTAGERDFRTSRPALSELLIQVPYAHGAPLSATLHATATGRQRWNSDFSIRATVVSQSPSPFHRQETTDASVGWT